MFTLATLFGFDLMPRIRNFADLTFFRASDKVICPSTDELYGERGHNVIDWKLIQRHWRDLMQVAASISQGRLSSAAGQAAEGVRSPASTEAGRRGPVIRPGHPARCHARAVPARNASHAPADADTG
ncbi:Tn3 family transposase [Nocardiopsis sp. YSL2]|uniref:Tn3 family transposase n=1 Tax=Nocardiopsis sp. YSL2 TaxID=2939492 RepID=UPI0026F432FE|nr:Tn3 family transposase [Nocardiopsis sp. YSL2]